MTRWHYSRTVILLLGVACLTSACSGPVPPPGPTTTIPRSVQVPATIERLAIVYPRTSDRDTMNAYRVLEAATFQLKDLRPSLRIMDRVDLDTVLNEQRFQLGGTISDETAVRAGRLVGVDSVLLYRVQGPTFRDRAFALFQGAVPPFFVTSKLIVVESAEVVFHNVVTTPVQRTGDVSSSAGLQPALQAALDRGLAQTIADLQHAFR